jgi:hypothetical protein
MTALVTSVNTSDIKRTLNINVGIHVHTQTHRHRHTDTQTHTQTDNYFFSLSENSALMLTA